jgi:hypothetical protein
MVIPSRWMAGGRGLGEFRAEFLGDRRIRNLVDYGNAKDAFPSVGIGGGICYFLWNREDPGTCAVPTKRMAQASGQNHAFSMSLMSLFETAVHLISCGR